VTALAEPREDEHDELLGLPLPKDIKERIKRGRKPPARTPRPAASARSSGRATTTGTSTRRARSGSSQTPSSTSRAASRAPHPEHVQLHPEHRRGQGQPSRSTSPATRSTRAARTTRTGRPRGSRSRSRSTATTSGISAARWARRSRRSRSCSARGSRCRSSTRTVGPFKNGEGQGEVRVLTFSRSEVLWEDGDDFLESRWHAIDRAVLLDDIKAIPGYVGGKLRADASTSRTCRPRRPRATGRS
jgi:hypothetical protein